MDTQTFPPLIFPSILFPIAANTTTTIIVPLITKRRHYATPIAATTLTTHYGATTILNRLSTASLLLGGCCLVFVVAAAALTMEHAEWPEGEATDVSILQTRVKPNGRSVRLSIIVATSSGLGSSRSIRSWPLVLSACRLVGRRGAV